MGSGTGLKKPNVEFRERFLDKVHPPLNYTVRDFSLLVTVSTPELSYADSVRCTTWRVRIHVACHIAPS
eukprot:5697875-Prymnesium_polylepis.1